MWNGYKWQTTHKVAAVSNVRPPHIIVIKTLFPIYYEAYVLILPAMYACVYVCVCVIPHKNCLALSIGGKEKFLPTVHNKIFPISICCRDKFSVQLNYKHCILHCRNIEQRIPFLFHTKMTLFAGWFVLGENTFVCVCWSSSVWFDGLKSISFQLFIDTSSKVVHKQTT